MCIKEDYQKNQQAPCQLLSAQIKTWYLDKWGHEVSYQVQKVNLTLIFDGMRHQTQMSKKIDVYIYRYILYIYIYTYIYIHVCVCARDRLISLGDLEKL